MTKILWAIGAYFIFVLTFRTVVGRIYESIGSSLVVEAGEDSPYRQEWIDQGGNRHIHWRIRVKNKTRKTITGIVVKVDSMNPSHLSRLPSPLRLMNTLHTVREFALRGGESRDIDVIEWTKLRLADPPPSEIMTLCDSLSDSGSRIPPQPYEIRLIVYRDVGKPLLITANLRQENGAYVFTLS